MPTEQRKCTKCGTEFEGTKRRQLCDKCRKLNKRAIDNAWRKKNPRKRKPTKVDQAIQNGPSEEPTQPETAAVEEPHYEEGEENA